MKTQQKKYRRHNNRRTTTARRYQAVHRYKLEDLVAAPTSVEFERRLRAMKYIQHTF